MSPRSSKRHATFCGWSPSMPVPSGKYGGLARTRSKRSAGWNAPSLRKSACRISYRASRPLYAADFLASLTLSSCASTATNRAPGSRHAAIIPTDPIPDPRSSTVLADGAQLVPYHAVNTSSVEKRCPLRSWKMRKWPLIASSDSSDGTSGGLAAPGGTGPGFAHPLKWLSATPNFQPPTPNSTSQLSSPEVHLWAELEAGLSVRLEELSWIRWR